MRTAIASRGRRLGIGQPFSGLWCIAAFAVVALAGNGAFADGACCVEDQGCILGCT